MRHDYRLDLTEQLVIATSGSDNSVTTPIQPNANTNPAAAKLGSWWLLQVSGSDAYLNQGAAATTANAIFSAGFAMVLWLPPGTAIHALAVSSGSGQVSLTRCLLSYQ